MLLLFLIYSRGLRCKLIVNHTRAALGVHQEAANSPKREEEKKKNQHVTSLPGPTQVVRISLGNETVGSSGGSDEMA